MAREVQKHKGLAHQEVLLISKHGINQPGTNLLLIEKHLINQPISQFVLGFWGGQICKSETLLGGS